MGEDRNKWGRKTFIGLDYADDLSNLNESVSKMNELLEVLWVQGAKRGLKINLKKINLLRLGISDDKKVTLSNKKSNQVDSFHLPWCYCYYRRREQ